LAIPVTRNSTKGKVAEAIQTGKITRLGDPYSLASNGQGNKTLAESFPEKPQPTPVLDNMFRTVVGQNQSTGTHITIPQTATVPSRGYATITNNYYNPNDYNPQVADPLAIANNPPMVIQDGLFQHPEIRKNICNLPGCNGIICIGLCGNPIGSKAIGHFTHGYPTIRAGQGTVVNLDANTDAKGLPDPQNAVMLTKRIVSHLPQ